MRDIAGAVLLGGGQRVKRILLPPGCLEDQEVFGRCHVPTDLHGGECGQTFYKGQESLWQRHVGDCARKHRDIIQALSPSEANRGTPFEDWDPEVTAHFRGVRERMLREGRMEVKRSERAGLV